MCLPAYQSEGGEVWLLCVTVSDAGRHSGMVCVSLQSGRERGSDAICPQMGVGVGAGAGKAPVFQRALARIVNDNSISILSRC